MKSYLASTLVFLLLVLNVFAQSTLTTATPAEAGFSAERLKRLDENINRWIEQNKLNGAVVMLVKDGKVFYKKGFGYNNISERTPMQPDLLFRLASQTKAITSVGVMMLLEEGKLLLDDPVANYIPGFKNAKVIDKFNQEDTSYTTVEAKRPVTIRDLLTHTSGVGYAQIGSGTANAVYAKNGIPGGIGMPEGPVLKDAMERLAKLPLMHQPGARFTYGLNTDILGYLIEVVSGESLSEFFHSHIFQPLGMNDTYFYVPAEKHNRLALLSFQDSTGIRNMPNAFRILGNSWNPNYPNTKGTYFSGGAGLTATISDYAKFLQMLLNGGSYNGKKILSRNSVDIMTTNQIGDINFGNDKFGLGFSIATEKSAGRLPVSVGTYGWGGIFGTTYWVDPKEKIVAQFYTQIWGRTFNVEDAFKVLVYQALNN